MRKIIINTILCILIIIFIYSSFKVYSISSNLNKLLAEFDSLKEKIELVNDNNDSTILAKYQEIYATNNDLIGWIKINDTLLDYPVMYTPTEPEFYLRKNYDKQYSVVGVPFIGANCSIDSSNIIIYGHNMKNGTMFGSLIKYKDIDYWKKHKYINFDTIYTENTYVVIGAFYSKVYKPQDENVFRYYNYTNIESQEEFDEYYTQVKKHSLYDTGISAEYGDHLLTLSTCENSRENGRFVVVCKRIE